MSVLQSPHGFCSLRRGAQNDQFGVDNPEKFPQPDCRAGYLKPMRFKPGGQRGPASLTCSRRDVSKTCLNSKSSAEERAGVGLCVGYMFG
jgi:hypothetical protein